MILCEITATDHTFTGSWTLARLEAFTTPRLAVRWLRAEAVALADRIDPTPYARWAPPNVIRPATDALPAPFDAATALRNWADDVAAQDQYLLQLGTTNLSVFSVDGLDAFYTLTAVHHRFTVPPWALWTHVPEIAS